MYTPNFGQTHTESGVVKKKCWRLHYLGKVVLLYTIRIEYKNQLKGHVTSSLRNFFFYLFLQGSYVSTMMMPFDKSIHT